MLPKLREIFAADFRDRVLHHLLVPRLEAVFEPKFIHDSYACRLHKGTHAAVRRLQFFMNSVSRSGRRPAWFIQLDIRSFFMSIDRARLLAMIERHITDAELLALASVIIKSDCTEHYAYKGAPGLLAQIPPHKSLFQVPAGKGLPIGNLTSQFFANVYLNELDQFVKHTLKCRHYLRYVDDFILLHESEEVLAAMKAEIENFLAARLQLQVKSDFCHKRVSEGSDFLGYIVRPDYVLIRKRVLGNLHGKLATFKVKMVVEGAVGRRRYVQHHLRPEMVTAFRQTLASYLGHFVHADSRRLIGGLWEKHVWLKDIFVLHPEGLLRPEYEPQQRPKSMHRQYRWAWQQFGRGMTLNKGVELPPVEGVRPWVCIFFQVGSFVEFFGRQAHIAGRVFGLALRQGRWPGFRSADFRSGC